MDRDNKDLLIYLFFAISFQMLGPTGIKKKEEEKKRTGSGLGAVLLTYVYVYTIVVCSKWGVLLRHRVVTPTREF